MSCDSPYSYITQFTQSAIPSNPAARYADYGFIAVLALAQRLGIEFLPVTWQERLGLVGKGGESTISQSLINVQTSFAFKRFIREPEIAPAPFQNIAREMVVLSQPSIRGHSYIVRLEGICWDIPQDDQVWPVLVFQKAHLGDLYQFSRSGIGRNLSMEDRLSLCVDIGIAIRDMHFNGKMSHTKAAFSDLSQYRYHPWRYQASEHTHLQGWH
jgi:hypothetical protein